MSGVRVILYYQDLGARSGSLHRHHQLQTIRSQPQQNRTFFNSALHSSNLYTRRSTSLASRGQILVPVQLKRRL